MRLSLLFFALCSALDEAVTFRNLAVGGVEFNPTVIWLLSISPLLYPIADAALIATTWAVDKSLMKRKLDPWPLWVVAGTVRLFWFAFSLVY